MSYLVENPEQTERVYTDSLEGYEDWTVIADGEEARPIECHDFVDGAWVANAEQEQARDYEISISSKSKDELVMQLAAELEDLRARVVTLEAYIGSL